MQHNHLSYRPIQIILFSTPLIIAIMVFELTKIQIVTTEIFKGSYLPSLLHLIPCFFFAYISDRHFRKKALILSHIIGLTCGIIFYASGMQLWALILIALTFNPISVARAALLDNFPHHAYLKLIAITFLVQQIPWIFFKQIVAISSVDLLLITILLLFFNTILTIFLFKDRKDLLQIDAVSLPFATLRKYKTIFFHTVAAFILADATMRMGWRYADTHDTQQNLTAILYTGLVIGIVMDMFYKRLPHMSIITLCYSLGLGFTLVALFASHLNLMNMQTSLLSMILFMSVVEGMYYPFVADAMVTMFGSRNKALGTAMIELSGAVSSLIAIAYATFFSSKPLWIVYGTCILLLLAAIIQIKAEKKELFQKD